jgi:hypothetical protein
VGPDGRKLLLIQGLPRAETPGSFDAYRAAKNAGVPASAKAFLLVPLATKGKCRFQRFGMGGDSGQVALTGCLSEIREDQSEAKQPMGA